MTIRSDRRFETGWFERCDKRLLLSRKTIMARAGGARNADSPRSRNAERWAARSTRG